MQSKGGRGRAIAMRKENGHVCSKVVAIDTRVKPSQTILEENKIAKASETKGKPKKIKTLVPRIEERARSRRASAQQSKDKRVNVSVGWD